MSVIDRPYYWNCHRRNIVLWIFVLLRSVVVVWHDTTKHVPCETFAPFLCIHFQVTQMLRIRTKWIWNHCTGLTMEMLRMVPRPQCGVWCRRRVHSGEADTSDVLMCRLHLVCCLCTVSHFSLSAWPHHMCTNTVHRSLRSVHAGYTLIPCALIKLIVLWWTHLEIVKNKGGQFLSTVFSGL